MKSKVVNTTSLVIFLNNAIFYIFEAMYLHCFFSQVALSRRKAKTRRHRVPFNPFCWSDDSHGNVGELLLGEVEGVIGHGDAVPAGILSCRQISPQDGVVGHTEEGCHAVPCLVVEPHLPR